MRDRKRAYVRSFTHVTPTKSVRNVESNRYWSRIRFERACKSRFGPNRGRRTSPVDGLVVLPRIGFNFVQNRANEYGSLEMSLLFAGRRKDRVSWVN